MKTMLRHVVVCLLAATLAIPAGGAAWGAGLEPAQPSKPRNVDFDNGRALVEQGRYRDAIPVLQRAVATEPGNADAFNLMGFATRKSGDARGSLQHYNKALSLDPKHLGAHEYIGEAYLMLGDVRKAEEHLARLDQLCLFGCREYRMLKEAIAAYKAGRRPGT